MIVSGNKEFADTDGGASFDYNKLSMVAKRDGSGDIGIWDNDYTTQIIKPSDSKGSDLCSGGHGTVFGWNGHISLDSATVNHWKGVSDNKVISDSSNDIIIDDSKLPKDDLAIRMVAKSSIIDRHTYAQKIKLADVENSDECVAICLRNFDENIGVAEINYFEKLLNESGMVNSSLSNVEEADTFACINVHGAHIMNVSEDMTALHLASYIDNIAEAVGVLDIMWGDSLIYELVNISGIEHNDKFGILNGKGDSSILCLIDDDQLNEEKVSLEMVFGMDSNYGSVLSFDSIEGAGQSVVGDADIKLLQNDSLLAPGVLGGTFKKLEKNESLLASGEVTDCDDFCLVSGGLDKDLRRNSYPLSNVCTSEIDNLLASCSNSWRRCRHRKSMAGSGSVRRSAKIHCSRSQSTDELPDSSTVSGTTNSGSGLTLKYVIEFFGMNVWSLDL